MVNNVNFIDDALPLTIPVSPWPIVQHTFSTEIANL